MLSTEKLVRSPTCPATAAAFAFYGSKPKFRQRSRDTDQANNFHIASTKTRRRVEVALSANQ
ncbi:hypothetical protein DYH55_06215 [Methylovirgula sp. 4M-Z18]|nr:hypothetical protein DYH55_06215 [Methylovirgula sp. 4M-Z18]